MSDPAGPPRRARPNRVRFGIVARTASSAAAWRDKVRRFESQGFDVVLVPDHLVGDRLSPLVALASAAASTSTIRLGTLVLANDFRHPTVLAKEAASLDVLSDGRLELGIGTGWMRDDYTRSGIQLASPAERVARLAEAIPIVRRALAGGNVTVSGAHYAVSGLEVVPPSIQSPVPILVGAGGDAMLRLAAREADIVNITNRTMPDGSGAVDGELGMASLRRKVDLLRREAAGRWDELELSVSVQAITLGGVDEIARRGGLLGDSLPQLTGTPSIMHGGVGSIADDIARWRAELGITYFVVHDENDAEAAAAVIDEIRQRDL